jgi:site-specific DNA recombinase
VLAHSGPSQSPVDWTNSAGFGSAAVAGRLAKTGSTAWSANGRERPSTSGSIRISQLSFAGVRLITLSEGEVGELHVGLKGTMNALFLKDLAQKTRRVLEGRVRQGKSGGGLCFGYDVVRKFDAAGEAVRGERCINEVEAAMVRRIFEEFANGRSPRAIAQSLNKDGIPGPAGRSWGPSTTYGNWQRGTGILNNELISVGWSGIVSGSSKTQIPEGAKQG